LPDQIEQVSVKWRQEGLSTKDHMSFENMLLQSLKKRITSYRDEIKYKDLSTYNVNTNFLRYMSELYQLSLTLTFTEHINEYAMDRGIVSSTPTRFPIPLDLVELYEDLVNSTAESIISLFSSIHSYLEENHSASREVIHKPDDLRLLFELVKRIYNDNTLNYEIYDGIEKQLNKLINTIQENDFHQAEKLSDETMMIFQTIVDTKKELKDAHTEMLTVEYTGEKIGEMRIYKTKID
jgi:hypothetical protein